VVVTNSPCSSANSAIATVTVSPTSVGGTIAGSASVCTGTNATTLTLSGHTGTITRWESSTSSTFASAVTSIANTTTTLTATDLTTTTYYRAVIKSGACSSVNSTIATVTVSPISIGGTVAGSATVCSGTNITTLTLSGHTGAITRWESSLDSFATAGTSIANTFISLTRNNLTATTYYRAVITSGGCAATNSTIAKITVSPASVGGTIAGSTTVCTGNNSTTLTLSGHTGAVIRWESSINNFATIGTSIANTTDSLTVTNLTTNTSYRAVVRSSPCNSVTSAIATINVIQVVGGTIFGNATVCTGTNSTTLTLSGYTGGIIRWESSLDNFATAGTNIANTTNTLTATDLTATTYYRALLVNSVCNSTYSATGTVTVSPVSVGGNVAGTATVCTGTNSTTLTLSGHTGAITRWESSLNNFATAGTSIANTTTTLTATNLTATTFYRAVLTSGACSSANSTTVTVTVSPASVGGTVSGGATVCTGTNSTTLTLSGHTGAITRWESSLDNFATAGTSIANTTTTLTATDLSATTYYRAILTSGVCSSVNSAIATVNVSPLSVGGTIAGSTSVCTGTTTILTLSGHTGAITRWESSLNNFATAGTNIANTTTTLITTLTATTSYRAVITNGACAATNSATTTVTVIPTSVGGTVAGSTTVCTGTNSTTLTLSGHTGAITRWESSTSSTFASAVTSIANTTTTLTASNLTATTYYRAVLTNGSCSSANSAIATVTVLASVGGTVVGSTAVCTGTNSTTLTLSGHTGAITRWESSLDSFATAGNSIANTTTSLTVTNLTATTYYRAVLTNGSCSSANSAIATVTVSPISVGGTIAGSTIVCTGINSTNLILSGHTGAITRWESSLDNFATAGTIIANTTTLRTCTNLTATTYYRAVITSGACPVAYSATATITVTPTNTAAAASSTPTICINSAITNITHTTSGATGISNSGVSGANGLPAGVSATWASNTITISGTPTASGTFNYSIPLTGGCGLANATGTITVTLSNTWGGVTTNWNDSQNWCSGVPAGTADITIPSGLTFYPIITTGTVQVNNITIASGASVTVNNGELSISGTITNSGSLNATNGSLTLNGTAAAQTISGSMFVGKTIKNLKISNSNGVSLGGSATDTLKLTGILNFGASNAILTTNDKLTLVSNATGTASVDDMTNNGANSGNDIIGNVTVERYIPNQPKAWRFLATPTSGQTIKNAWMEGNAPLGNNKPGYGAIITSNNPGALSLGFDIQTASNSGPSMKTYNPATGNWNGVANANTQMIANKKGYMVFIRGDRSVTAFNQAATATTLRTTGQLYTRGVNAPAPTTVLPGKMESIGNPYAAEIDFTLLTKTGSIDNTFYVWDPLLTVGSNGLGGYQTISATNGWKPTPGGTANYDANVVCKTIKSGYAFFVFSSGGGGTVSFTETAKTNSLISRQQNQHNMAGRGFLRTNLFNAAGALTDGNVVAFDQAFSNDYDGNDALKLINATENLGIQRDTNNLSVEARSPVNTEDTVFYTINNMRAQAYRLKFMPENMNDANVSALLVDRFLNTTTAINLNDSTVVNFSITANTASAAANRFYLVFKPIVLLPVTITGISAGRNSNGTITVNWKSENETAIEKYELERGGDGRNFSRIKTVLPVANNGARAEYTKLDETPLSGNNFYRIKAISTNGLVQYSNIAKVADIRSEYRIAVFPNPVINKTINISFSNQSAGRYIIQLINALGQTALSKSEMLDAAPQTKKIALGNQLPSGNYELKIIAPDGQLIVNKLLIP
jgi:hypothetical protein